MILLGEEVPLKENLGKSLLKYRWLWFALLVTAALDFVSTVSFMGNVGIDYEKNFVIRWLAQTIGIIPGVLLGKFLQILAAIVFSALSFKLARAILLLILLLNLMAIAVNLF